MAASTDVARRPRFGWLLGARGPAQGEADSGPRAAAAPVELSPALATARWILVAVSGLAVWLVAYAFVFSDIQEHRAQHTLYAEFREKLASPNAPARLGFDQQGHPIPLGEPVVLLNSPAAGLSNLVVVEGTGAAQLRSGPGHRRDTPLPGQDGTAVLYGRSVTFGGPFAKIDKLRQGDEIWAVTGQGRFEYAVTDVRRAGDPVPQPPPPGGSHLWLVTSESSGWRSGWAPGGTIYVDATLVKPKKAQPTGGYLSTEQLPTDENPMKGDTSGLIPLIFWLQGLLVVAIGMVWAWRRWGAWQTWAVGVPAMLALVWGATSSAALVLPNLI